MVQTPARSPGCEGRKFKNQWQDEHYGRRALHGKGVISSQLPPAVSGDERGYNTFRVIVT